MAKIVSNKQLEILVGKELQWEHNIYRRREKIIMRLEDFALAKRALSGIRGKLSYVEKPHQLFEYILDDKEVCIVFYPHKTSAGNYHTRVRDQGSKNKSIAKEIMAILGHESGCNCTFSTNNSCIRLFERDSIIGKNIKED